MRNYISVSLLFMAFDGAIAGAADDLTVEILVPTGAVARARDRPGIFAELKITNNLDKAIVIRCRQDVRYNLVTETADKNGKTVSRTVWMAYYPDMTFESKDVEIGPKQSVTQKFQLTNVPKGKPLDVGEYKVTGTYNFRGKELKTNTATFRVAEDTPKTHIEAVEKEQKSRKKD